MGPIAPDTSCFEANSRKECGPHHEEERAFVGEIHTFCNRMLNLPVSNKPQGVARQAHGHGHLEGKKRMLQEHQRRKVSHVSITSRSNSK